MPHPLTNTRRRLASYRRTIHQLNQRYHREWLRAEWLERELARVRGRWFGPLVATLKWLKRSLLPARADHDAYHPVGCPTLAEPTGAVAGKVSIVIPFKDKPELLRGVLRSIRRSSHADHEIILVDNGSTTLAMARLLERVRQQNGIRVLDRPGPFNFSRVCNEGAQVASGDFLLFLNNDMELLSRDWMERLLCLTQHPEVGIVSGMLFYPDGTIQHAGIFARPDGRWVHGWRDIAPSAAPTAAALAEVRVVPAVTGACLLLRRRLFEDLGGFDEQLPVTYSDVDLCRRARERGLQSVVTPHARLIHYECLTRGHSQDAPGAAHLATMQEFPDEAR